MENLLNPVIVAVLLLCVLCLLKVNVLLSMLVSLFVAGLIGGLPLVGDDSIMSSVIAGFSGNAETALAYVLLGTFASAMAYFIGNCMCISEYYSDSHCIHPNSGSTITGYDEQDETG